MKYHDKEKCLDCTVIRSVTSYTLSASFRIFWCYLHISTYGHSLSATFSMLFKSKILWIRKLTLKNRTFSFTVRFWFYLLYETSCPDFVYLTFGRKDENGLICWFALYFLIIFRLLFFSNFLYWHVLLLFILPTMSSDTHFMCTMHRWCNWLPPSPLLGKFWHHTYIPSS